MWKRQSTLAVALALMVSYFSRNVKTGEVVHSKYVK
jgi:hypothetical protein